MGQEIAKSPEILEKEALIKDLQSQLKKRKSILKGLKTRLENTKNQITDVQRSGSGQVMSKMSQMEQLRLELLDLIQQMSQLKGLSREDKAALKDMKQQFSDEDIFGEGFSDYKAQMKDMESEDFEAQFDENERAKMRDMFETFAVKPDKVEQKNIRKIFINLSQKFHPDKATTKADEKEYHEMMQKINEAYQAGDIQTLLELEQLFLSEKLDLTKVQSFSVDVLQQEIDRLERDLQFIENQIDRNSQEIKALRASDLGLMLTDLAKAEKEGMGLNAAFAELDESIRRFTQMRDAFSECIKVGNIQPLHEMMMAENAMQPSQEEMMAMLEEMMGGKMSPEDLADMFGGDDFFGEGDTSHAKFEIDMSVKIAKKVYDEESGIALGGLQGRVVDIYAEPGFGVMYEIELDSISVNKLPLEYIAKMVAIEEDFQNFQIEESDLKKCQARDSTDDTLGAYRMLFNEFNWNHKDEATKKRLKSILLEDANSLDSENWNAFLLKNLKFPIAVQSRGLMEFKRGEKFKITGIAGNNDTLGLIVDVKYRNRLGDYPLFDLMPTAKNKGLRQIFEDYLIWAIDILELDRF